METALYAIGFATAAGMLFLSATLFRAAAIHFFCGVTNEDFL